MSTATTAATTFVTRREFSQDLASLYPGRKCGIVIAGNAGRPGGALGRFPDIAAGWHQLIEFYIADTKTFSTQEEDVVASWIRGELRIGRKSIEALHAGFIDQATGRPKWGLVPCEQTMSGLPASPETYQGIDYTQSLNMPEIYDMAVLVDHAAVESRKRPTRVVEDVALAFTFGPNVGCSQTPTGSTARTHIRGYRHDRDYGFFRAAVKVAVAAALRVLDSASVEVALVCKVSGGIYAGESQPHITADYPALVAEIVAENNYSHIKQVILSV